MIQGYSHRKDSSWLFGSDIFNGYTCPLTERIVQEGMDALMKGRISFMIAHHLSTIRKSDVMMVLDHGCMIERGSHEKLIEDKGTYYQLYTGVFELEKKELTWVIV